VEVEVRVFWELICSEAASFSEPLLPPKVAFLRHAFIGLVEKVGLK
jgi:hypothetical protein